MTKEIIPEQFYNLSPASGLMGENHSPKAMKNFFLLSLTVVTLLACQKDELKNAETTVVNACGVTNPIEDLPWLKERLQTATDTSSYCIPSQVIQGIYQGKTVYIIPITGTFRVACCTCAGNAVYDCEGKLVFVCDTAEEAKIANKEVLWEI